MAIQTEDIRIDAGQLVLAPRNEHPNAKQYRWVSHDHQIAAFTIETNPDAQWPFTEPAGTITASAIANGLATATYDLDPKIQSANWGYTIIATKKDGQKLILDPHIIVPGGGV